MQSLALRLIMLWAAVSLSGCAAMITREEPPEPTVIQSGTTRMELTQRLGLPVRSATLSPSKEAIALWDADHAVSVLLPRQLAITESVFAFKGRLGKDARVAQAGFDSFMTLGLAELFLIPKALWQRTVDEDLELTVWFGSDGRALAFKWSDRKS